MNYLYFLFYLFFFLLSFVSKGQLVDDFSDGNMSQNPLWYGDTSDFAIIDERLQLNAIDGGSSLIYSPFSTEEENTFEWNIEIELDLSPSVNNSLDFVLYSSDSLFFSEGSSFIEPVYLLHFGESGSEDAIELQRIDSLNAEAVIICRGIESAIASSFRKRYKVIYNEGIWEVHSADYFSPYFIFEASGYNNIDEFQNAFLGIQVNYTSSHVTDSYFDNIYFGLHQIDTISAEIENIEIVSATGLYLFFTESVDSSALNTNNYVLQNSLSTPIIVEFIDSYQKGIRMEFEEGFTPWSNSIIIIDSLFDIEQNLSINLIVNFIYSPEYEAQAGEIRFNEIMADPTPLVGLPEVEYIELINVSDSSINLESYSIVNSTIPRYLPTFILEADEQVVICKEEHVSEMEIYGNVIGIPNWISLLNTGDSLILVNKSGELLDEVNYFSSWFEDPLKKEGGWSLERINANVNCKSEVNWKECSSFYGGTPGLENSVVNDEIVNNVNFIQAYPVDSLHIRMEMEGELDTTLFTSLMYSSSPPLHIDFSQSKIDESGVLLTISSQLLLDESYLINLDNLKSCTGENFPSLKLKIGYSKIATPGDIVINEILFNPYSGANDFIEIYNKSSKFVDLKNWRIVELDAEIITEDVRISDNTLILAPKQLMAFSKNKEELPFIYSHYTRANLFELNDLPNFSNDEGRVKILTNEFIVMDSLDYNEEMHFSLLDDFKGVSLERIDPAMKSNEISSWTSAAESVNFATPGYSNSQFSAFQYKYASVFIEPQLFTPDNDAHNDALFIHYNVKAGGWMASVKIYSDQGKVIRNLVGNKWIENEGLFRWDGLDDNEEEVDTGIYIVFFEIFNSLGQIERVKKVCVVGKML
jgi:hypothetical protein